MKIIVHAGFHKTGTTSLQKTLRTNRKALAATARIILRPGMKALCQAARGWSVSGDALDLGLVKYEAALLGETLQKKPAPCVILSSEDLSGHMPGRVGVKTYAAVPELMQSIALGLGAALPKAQIEFFFTTRKPDAWLASCYAQHLRASRMRLLETEYAAKFAKSAKLNKIIDRVAAALPEHTVTRAALKDCGHRPLGPTDALLDQLGLDVQERVMLKPSPLTNPAPNVELLADLLALNRSDLSDAELRTAKRNLLKDIH